MSKTGFQRAGDLVAVHGKRGNAEGRTGRRDG